LLVAGDVVPAACVDGTAFIGEVGLDGTIRPVPGVVALVDAIDAPRVVVPPASAAEARLVGRHDVRSAPTVAHLLAALAGEAPWPDPPPPRADVAPRVTPPDLRDVRGHPFARLALEVAAAGGHHL
jgi:magnesium chelatase family protein